jgi:hypothetical protein
MGGEGGAEGERVALFGEMAGHGGHRRIIMERGAGDEIPVTGLPEG